WHRQNNPALHAYYYYQAMSANKSKQTLESVADTLVYAYKTTEDSVILNNLITFALRSYEEAVKQDTSDVDLRLKLAEAYIQGSQEPMKGVAILKELENKHPNDINILMSLGRLSIQSGQLDKAKERLKKILTLEPQNREAIYFLAITEAQLGHTEEAIRLFELCKLMVNNEDFNKEIDEIVKNLKSKKV
ncbi:MAG TPA: tetratricopeptide repeat protein, partial [Chitinophagales bacterium]|nr:tetratricopeptide repeat protein [Chitinophagales bacterium]